MIKKYKGYTIEVSRGHYMFLADVRITDRLNNLIIKNYNVVGTIPEIITLWKEKIDNYLIGGTPLTSSQDVAQYR